MTSTFTCVGLSLPGDQDPLGVWELRVRQATPAVSVGEAYGVSMQAEHPTDTSAFGSAGLVWVVAHPAGGQQAFREGQRELRVQLAAVERRDRALDTIETRLAGLSPMPAYRADVDPHEAALFAEIAVLQGAGAYAVPGVSSGTISHRQLYQQAERVEAARSLLIQLRRLVHHWAWIETQVGQERIALTTVDWTGDYQTTWLDGLTVRETGLHLDAVRLALASRHALLRLMIVAVTGALELALKASVTGGQILLIPAVYRYVRDLLAELGELPVGEMPSWHAVATVG